MSLDSPHGGGEDKKRPVDIARKFRADQLASTFEAMAEVQKLITDEAGPNTKVDIYSVFALKDIIATGLEPLSRSLIK